MSVKVMSWVWEHSRAKSTDRLVLLAIADCAADNGSNAYPSVAELMRKTGLSERGVQGSIGKLVALKELAVQRNAGPRGCNRYRVLMTPADPAPPQEVRGAPPAPAGGAPPADPAPLPPQEVHHPPAPDAPGTVLEPSLEPSEKIPSPKRSSSRRRRPDLSVPDRPDVEQVCQHLADRIEANGSKRPTVTQTWRDAARRLIEKDGRTVEQIMKAIDWCQDDEFWRGNILSMPTLREKYDRLRLAAQRSNGRREAKRSTTDERMAQGAAILARLEAGQPLEIGR